MSEWITIINENHTDYCACYQHIKWNPEVIAGYQRPNGFIVQRFSRTSSPKDLIIKDTFYYEAWKVENGICVETVNEEYDDQFAVARPICQLEAFRDSIYKSGTYQFKGEVFWVDMNNDNELFGIVDSWPRDEVEQAGGLLAVFDSNEFSSKEAEYIRKPFVHAWSMASNEEIYSAAKKALFRMCPNPESTRDQEIFKSMLEDILLEEQQEFKDRLLQEWKTQ